MRYARPSRGSGALELVRLAPRDPRQALPLAAAARLGVVAHLPLVTRALLATELARTGGVAAAHRLLDAEPQLRRIADALIEPPWDLSSVDADLDLRAVVTFARARRDSAPERRARLYEDARRRDVLKADVSTAVFAWPPP
ncbi:MAG TPA: hypothetical protein VGQ83_30735 [Polyangia bacterium]|jgi:hypothetical protein